MSELNSNIRKISSDIEKSFESNYNVYYRLGIYSLKSAKVLNMVIHNAVRNANFNKRYQSWYSYSEKVKHAYEYEKKVGGGCLVQTGIEFTVNDFNEIGVYLHNPYKTDFRSANSREDRLKLLKDKLANALKIYWRGMAKSANETEIAYQMPVMDDPKKAEVSSELCVTFDEYRTLYEFLKGRNSEKSIKNHGQESCNSMIGKAINDQFIITSINTLNDEIKSLNDEARKKINELTEELRQKKSALDLEYRELTDSIKAENDQKVNALKLQLEDIKKLVNH